MRNSLIINSLVAGMMLCCIGATAEERWCAVAGPVDIPLDDIECFVATDGEYTLNIVLGSGMVLSNVSSVSFALREIDGVEAIVDDGDMMLINNVIHITCSTGHDTATVVDLGGRKMATGRVVGGECTIDIRDLSAGVYILRLGNKAIKFVKR